MDATDILCEIGEAFFHAKLEAVMIGNAGRYHKKQKNCRIG